MAIKKCDEVTETQVPTIEGEDSAAAARAVPQRRVPQVRENTHLGKVFQAIERTIYDDLLDDPADQTGQINAMLSTVSTFGNGDVRANRPMDIADPLRAEAHKFFTADSKTGQMKYVNNNLNAGQNTCPEYDTLYGMSIWNIEFTEDPQACTGGWWTDPDETVLFKRYKQNMKVSSNMFVPNYEGEWANVWDKAGAFESHVAGESWMLSEASRPPRGSLIDTDTEFTDHYTNISIPFSKQELERYVNNVNNPLYADVEPKYNFYLPGYEEYIAKSRVLEQQLPNLYSALTQGDNTVQRKLEIWRQSHKNSGTGLDYVKGAQALKAAMGQDLTDHFQNIGIPSSKVSILQQSSLYDDVYPMNNTLVLQTDKNGAFITAAESAGMTDDLMKFIMNETYGVVNGLRLPVADNPQNAPLFSMMPTSNRIEAGEAPEFVTKLLFETSSETVAASEGGWGEPEYSIRTERSEQELQIVDLGRWLTEVYLNTDSTYYEFPHFSDESIMLGMPESATNQCSTFLGALMSLVLTGKVQQLIDQYFRTFAEVLEGKEAYNETVIYEIVKTPSYSGAKTQRIFVPNTEELDILQYIDTQVKYGDTGVKYTYEVFAHQLVIGTKYKYSGKLQSACGNGTLPVPDSAIDGLNAAVEFSVVYEPSLQIIRLPIYTETEQIFDHPPIFPNVDLVPYKDVPTSFLINLSSNVGEYEVQPIEINNDDKRFIQNYRKSRKLLPEDPIIFKSDDPTKRYEIYRTSTPPKSYQDFAGNLLTQLSSDIATAISYVDHITPNQKYYYMFRSIDVHGNRSNPTEVYEVELVNFEGMTFFNNKMYEFEDTLRNNNNISNSRDFRRYLKINPNFIQSLINYDQTFPVAQNPQNASMFAMMPTSNKIVGAGTSDSAYNADNVIIGQAGEPVWNKRFKVRVTSKNSGKKFDLNITCKVEYNKNSKPSPAENPQNASMFSLSDSKLG